jgi:hypothetical protein
MRIFVSFLTACLILGLTVHTPAQTKKKKWQPATYKGLTTGKSTRAAVLKLFGKPMRKDFTEPDSPEVWYIYKDIGDFPGEFTVAIDNKTQRVRAMFLSPDGELKKDVVLKHLGDDWEITRYESCPGDYEVEGPVYENDKGHAEFIEYRSKGIAVLVGYQDRVNNIEYLESPPGLSSVKKCPPDSTKARRVTKRKV